MSELAKAFRREVAAALAHVVGDDARFEPLSGGSVDRAFRVRGSKGSAFVKTADGPVPDRFAAEAAGLTAIATSGVTAHGVRVPRVFIARDDPPAFLALEDLGQGRARPDFDEALGRGLAALHRVTDARGFGFECDTFCGGVRQENGWCSSWVDFWRERRLIPQLRHARAAGMASADLAAIERVTMRVERLVGAPEPSALIHGDLWSGNVLVANDGRPALIDPSASFAHREAELGMMVLFGGFSERVFASYRESFPLAPGWRERLPLYSLYHLLNHFHLFGGGYGAQAVAVARQLCR